MARPKPEAKEYTARTLHIADGEIETFEKVFTALNKYARKKKLPLTTKGQLMSRMIKISATASALLPEEYFKK